MTSSHHGSVWNVLGRCRFTWRMGAIALLTLALMGGVAVAPADADSTEREHLLVKKAPPAVCAKLDDPAIRGRMDGLLYKLLVSCGRGHELGTVTQSPAVDTTGQEAGPVVPDVQVNDSTGDDGTASHTQSETSIAYSETTGTICSGYNDSFHGVIENTGFTGISRSTDGGATFVDLGALGANSFGDPSLIWSRADENFYIAALESNGLGIWRSTDDCASFQFLANTHVGTQDDKEILAIDNTPGSPFFGRMYVGWTDFNDGRIYVNYSSDNGATWSTALAVSTGGDVQGAWPVVAPNGDVFVGWVRWNPFPDGPIDIEIVRSTDGGDSFTAVTNPITGEVNPRDNAATGSCFRPALDGNIRYLPSPQLVVGPDGVLHVVYSYDPDGFDVGDEIDVFYRRSLDSGATWEPEIRLNDDATTNDQFFPTLSVGAGNTVISTWYDRRLDPGNLLFDYYQRTSFDGGATWQPSIRISDVSSPVYLDPNLAGCYHGDYDTQIQTPAFNLIQWSDDRLIQDGHNDPDVWFEKVPIGTDFLLTANPATVAVCAPDDADYVIDVLQFEGFTEPVTLAASGEPAGTTAAFSDNPVTPPGMSTLTLTVAGTAPGSYTIDVTGTSDPSAIVQDTSVTLDVFDAVPAAPVQTAPADSSTGVDLVPVLEWDAAAQAVGYFVEVATDAGFTSIVYSSAETGTSHQVTTPLDPLTEYHWRVRANNLCGDGVFSGGFSFTTRDIPPILVVDDDDNTPDTRAETTDALDALGLQYDLWDTNNSDSEPSDLELAPYDVVIWFTGDEFGGAAGPGGAGEAALTTWLDAGGNCLFLSSQDYHFDRGLTTFMDERLGVAAVTDDTTQTDVTGNGPLMGLGPYTLSYNGSNFSDTVTADADAAVAFDGNAGEAAVSKEGTNYRTMFWGFPFSAIPAADRAAVMDAVLGYCSGEGNSTIFTDGFESGDTTSWSFIGD